MSKKCITCLKEKPLLEFHFPNARNVKSNRCKECKQKYQKQWIDKNRCKVNAYNLEYAKTNKTWLTPEKRLNACKYLKKRKLLDPEFHLRTKIKLCIFMVLSRPQKTSWVLKYVGCTSEQLRKHFEDQFLDGMSWGNMGRGENKWSVDHIRPISSFNMLKEEEIFVANNFKNLRPMWWAENNKRYWKDNHENQKQFK